MSDDDYGRAASLTERLLAASVALVCAASVVGFAGKLWWFLDLFSHFRVQYLVCAGLLAPIAVAYRRAVWAIALAMAGAINLVAISPYLTPEETARTEAPAMRQFRAMTLNVSSTNNEHERVLSFIRESRPDVLLLVEVTPAWREGLSELDAMYDEAMWVPREDSFGIALFTAFALERADIVRLDDVYPPAIKAILDINGRRLVLLGAHLLAPPGRAESLGRNRQLAAIPDLLRGEPGAERLVLGDLNVSPWSPHFQGFLRVSGLTDSSRGKGLHATWPSGLEALAIPIDHCLVSRGLSVVGERVGPGVGSDHFPLVVDLAFSE